MKNRKINIGVIGLWCVFMFSACYDDKSTLPSVEYPDIVAARSTEENYLTVPYGEPFKFAPRLGRLEGRDTLWLTENDYDDFSYSWKITLLAGADTTSRLISRERVLDITVTSNPSSGNNLYTLMLQMVHKLSGVTKQLNWKLKVMGTYDSGLLVADTKDEQSSDLSLIMSRCYNSDIPDYSQDVIRRDVFSLINGNAGIEGVVSSLSYLSANSLQMITALVKGESLIRIDPVTMKEEDRDLDLFYYTPAVFNPQLTCKIFNYNVLINAGGVQFYEPGKGMKYSYVSDAAYDLAEVVVPFAVSKFAALVFDRTRPRFLTFSARNAVAVAELPKQEGVFDPANMEGYELIYGDPLGNNTARCLMKKGNDYFICQISDRYAGEKIFDMGECNLAQATCYALSEKYDEFFYGIENKLYVAVLNADKPAGRVVYDKFGENEKITHILMHKGSKGFTTWDENPDGTPNWRRSWHVLLSVVTYNERTKEGKVYALPIQYTGNGGIAGEKYVRVFDRFGRITAIATR